MGKCSDLQFISMQNRLQTKRLFILGWWDNWLSRMLTSFLLIEMSVEDQSAIIDQVKLTTISFFKEVYNITNLNIKRERELKTHLTIENFKHTMVSTRPQLKFIWWLLNSLQELWALRLFFSCNEKKVGKVMMWQRKFITWIHLIFTDENIHMGKKLCIAWSRHRFCRKKYIYVDKNLCGEKENFEVGFLPTFILVYGHISCCSKYFKYVPT